MLALCALFAGVSRNMEKVLALFLEPCQSPSMPAKIQDKERKKLIKQNVRLPLDVVIWMGAEKYRSGASKEDLVLRALLEKYPIRTK